MPAKSVPAASPSSLASMAREVQAQIANARDRLNETRGRLNEVLAERERILSAPTHPGDVRGILVQNLRRRALDARGEVDQLIGEVHKLAASSEVAHGTESAVYGAFDGKVTAAMLCAVIPAETLADAMLSLATVEPSASAGLPVIERRAKIEELDRQGELLRGEIAELVAALEAAGVSGVSGEQAEPAKPNPEDRYDWTSHGWILKDEAA
jgi:hypothetical protein